MRMILVGLLCAACFAAGLIVADVETQSANEALRAGFRIFDSEGYEVERFDGWDYWTTTPKTVASPVS